MRLHVAHSRPALLGCIAVAAMTLLSACGSSANSAGGILRRNDHGPSESETLIASLVDPLKDLPRVEVTAPTSDPWRGR